MTPPDVQEIIATATAAGLRLVPIGDRLKVQADRQPPAELLAVIRENKVAILAALAPAPPRFPEDWRDEYEERAGILEQQAHHPRPEAELLALEEIVDRWTAEHRAAHPCFVVWALRAVMPNAPWQKLECWQGIEWGTA